MIKNKEIAKEVSDVLLKCGAEINESIRYVMENSSEKEFLDYRNAMGKVMGELYFEGLKPIFKEFPELKPDGLE